jgi:hypothetical protein
MSFYNPQKKFAMLTLIQKTQKTSKVHIFFHILSISSILESLELVLQDGRGCKNH